MMMRSRDAWLATIAAVLGASEIACKKDAVDGPAAAREVPSASSSAPIMAASAPSETASVEAIASVVPSASASTKPPATIDFGTLGNIGTPGAVGSIGIGAIGHGACGVGRVNPSCGATVRREPITTVNASLEGGGTSEDAQRVQTSFRSRLYNCANGSGQTIQGSAVLQLDVDAHGAVTRVDSPQGTLDAPMLECVKRAARTVKLTEGAPRSLRVRVFIDRRSF